MVAPIYANRKGIYSDLYREIDAENNRKDASKARKPKKGIYVNLYKQLENDKRNIFFKHDEDEQTVLFIQFVKVVKKVLSNILSKISYFFSAVAGEFKMLAMAFVIAKKPINNYIDQNLPAYENEGNYYNA